MFPDIEYLDWIAGRPEEAEHDLGSSDLHRAPPETGRVVPPALSGLADPPAHTTLREQIAAEYGVNPGNVLVTAGATHANLLAAATALDLAEVTDPEGDADEEVAADHVLVEKPGYEPLLATPEALGGTVDRFRRPPEEGYPLDPGRIAAAAVAETALVVVTNRHNPSGRRTDRETLAAAAEAAADAGAYLLVDEVYAPFDDEPADGPFGGPSAAGLENAVVTNSLTKFFGLGDVRLGWLVADEAFVDRARSVANHVHAVAEPSRRLGKRTLANADDLGESARERIRTNGAELRAFVERRDDLEGRVEPGCTYAFLRHAEADGDAVAAAARERGVLVVPGRFFDDDDSVRISAARRPEAVRAGLDALGAALDDL